MKLNLKVIDTDTKKAKLTVASNKEVRIKLNRHWNEGEKQVITDTLSKVAEDLLKRNLGFTLRGQYDPRYPKVIQMKSSNKTNPKVVNVQVQDVLSQYE